MGALAQAHRAGQPRAALEGVQRAHAARGAGGVARARSPVAHARSQLRQQLGGFFFKDREQLGVDRIDGVDLVVVGDAFDPRRGDAPGLGQRRRLAQGVVSGLAERQRRAGAVLRFERHRQRRRRLGGLDDGYRQRRRLGGHLGRQHGGGQVGRRCSVVERQFMRVGGAVLGLGLFRLLVQPLGTVALVVDQARHQLGGRRLEEAGGELMQQTADLVGTVVEQRGLVGVAMAQRLRTRQCMLEQARQVRQVGEADRGRIASQRMRQRHRVVIDRAMQLMSPFGQLGAQAARLLVGLVEEDVEQRDAHAQRADHLVRLGFGLGCRRRRLGGRLARQQRDRATRRHRRGRRRLGDVERHHRRHRVGARRIGVELGRGQGLHGPGAGHRQPGRFAEVELEGHFFVGREQLVDRLDRRGGRAQFQILGARQIGQQVEQRHRRRDLGHGQRAGGGLHGGRFGHSHLALVQQHRRARQGQRAMLAMQAEFVDGTLDIQRAVTPVAALANGLDPIAQVGQHIGGQCQQFAVGRLAVGQAAVVELLARPGGFAEGRQADHARAALQGVEGAAHGGHLAEVFGCRDQRGQRLLGIADHFARFLEEDLAHLVVVFEPRLASRGRRGRQHRQRP